MVRIGLLLDNLKIKRWQNEIINYIKSHPNLELTTFIINANKPKYVVPGSFFYRASQVLDRKIFPVKKDVFKEISLEKNEKDLPIYYIEGEEKRFSYRVAIKDIERIKDLDLDIMIRFGFGILRGGILDAAKNGVWSLHHGDNRINRGGPPAFWEVANREDVTGITLQKLSEELDGGKVIKRSFIKTNTTSFYRNKNEAFWAGIELFNLALDELSRGILKYEVEKSSFQFYCHPLYKDPDNSTSVKILLLFWSRRILEVAKEKFSFPQWYILYKFKKDSFLEKNIFRYKTLYPPKGYDWADPFIIKENQRFYLFFEEIKIGTGNGHISLFQFDEKGTLLNERPVEVLNEEYHLSYPFIFKEDSNYYMLPESADANELWLYKSEEFPERWKKYQKIFSNKQIYDASLYFHEGYWYLFGTEKLSEGGNRDQYLHLYYSKELDSENWVSHPLNPLSLDVRGARPAGKIFKENGRLLRPTQIGAPKYGYGIQINEIKQLSTTEFIEEKLSDILPKWDKDLLAAHTLNFEEGFTVIDAQGKIKK
ncbi:hypothetical protein DET49_12534 [Salegentibacter sp. 24]|uniref:glucosamine inositolphosphorylceramide transferase family protein n=1 Tax=Salegentibacter sp. 24 TaxID=2183986 RepID=UPI001061F6D6|nr:hypothetical protein [Salegentibacter sp. 24]TDN82180.1 hypothetical protein DET49_12534 [Salegentibacter sp. 24]